MTKTPATKRPSPAVRLRARIARLEGKIQRGDERQRTRRAKLAQLKKRLEGLAALIFALSVGIQVTGPPLSPEEAVRVLQASHSDRHVRDLFVETAPQPPRMVVVTRPVDRPRVPSPAEVPWAVRQALPWRHVAPAPEDPTIRTVRIIR